MPVKRETIKLAGHRSKISGMNFIRKLGKSNIFVTFLVLVGMCILMSFLSPVFLTPQNLLNVGLQTAVNAILAVGLTFVILTAGIDLSVGSILAFAGVVMASALKSGVPVWTGVLVALAVGGACGLVNGLLITKGNLPPFISTLGMMSVARGLALVYTGGRPISAFEESFRFLGGGSIVGIPTPIIIVIIVYVVAYVVLNHMKLGRYTYAIGGNVEAAKLSGINVKKYLTYVYVISGVMAGLASVILTARLNSAQPIAGISYELDAIAAVVIGGTSLMGGQGNIIGSLIGALIMGVLRNGLNLLNVSAYMQQVAIGSIIIIAVLIDKYRTRDK